MKVVKVESLIKINHRTRLKIWRQDRKLRKLLKPEAYEMLKSIEQQECRVFLWGENERSTRT